MPNAGDEINVMSCHQIEPHIVDLARGVTSDETREAQLARHVLGCPSCAGRLEQERAMSAALRRLANDLREPAADPRLEQALLAIFDRAVARRGSHRNAPVWTWLAAASVAFAAVLTWHLEGTPNVPPVGRQSIVSGAPETEQARTLDSAALVTAAQPEFSRPSRVTKRVNSPRADARAVKRSDSTEFVAWPDAAAWPPFESGELIGIDIPTDVGVVRAEVLVGQDGFARAIRLIQ